jgi:ABC-type branched-subunit amino acid transport system substrate-binding protein
MKIINQVANKYKVIAMDFIALSDELYDAKNFTQYSFMTCFQTSQIGRAAAYYYGQIRKKETKFYVLCQDYLFGHSLAKGFIEGMKEYYPSAEIVGEDYHKLFLTDFAPYLTKIKASGAEVIYTGDWIPDAAALVKQARQMGINLPFAHLFLDDPVFLTEVGVEASKGLVKVSQYGQTNPTFKNDGYIKYVKAWNDQWKKWSAPYNTVRYKWPTGSTLGSVTQQVYWLLSVIERAGSTDPEKIIKVWEGDSYEMANGKVISMRACDHKAIQDLHIFEQVPPDEQKQSMNIPPYKWFDDCSFDGPVGVVPAAKIMPYMDPAQDRCK